ncbi:MAG: ACT domain-containing protein [Candidatus Acidiferrales bacterium]
MPTAKEFAIRMEDRPGMLGKACQALADRGVNILAFQSFPSSESKSLVRFVVDNPTTTKTVLDTEKLNYTVAEVAQVKLPHRPGALAQAAQRDSAKPISTSTMPIAASSQVLTRRY